MIEVLKFYLFYFKLEHGIVLGIFMTNFHLHIYESFRSRSSFDYTVNRLIDGSIKSYNLSLQFH